LDDADAKGSRLFRTFNNKGNITLNVDKAIRRKGNMKFDPILFEGDVINIERREKHHCHSFYGNPFGRNGPNSWDVEYRISGKKVGTLVY